MKNDQLAKLLQNLQLESDDKRNRLLDEMKVEMDVEPVNSPNSIYHYRNSPMLDAAKGEPQASVNPVDELSRLRNDENSKEELSRKLRELALRSQV